jgi:hypothetical protein
MALISNKVIQGKVVRVLSPTELVINLGSSHGVIEDSKFIVFALGEEMKDPDTGESLGQLEIVKGRAEVKHVQEKMSTVRSTEQQKSFTLNGVTWIEAPLEGVQVGDLVRAL